jgi:hypothetical protein
MRPAILLIGVLLLSVQTAQAWNVTNTYATQGAGIKDCGAPPQNVWTQISADNAGYPCDASSVLGVFLCECDANPNPQPPAVPCPDPVLDYWSYIIHGSATFGTQVELRASESCADSDTCAGSGTSITLQKPTEVNFINEAVQPNDVMVTQLAAYTSGQPLQPPTPPAGSTWTEITNTGTSAEQEWVFYHIAQSSEPSSYTWTFDTSVVAAAGGIADYANVNTSNPVGSVNAAFNSNSTNISCPSINATANQQALCFMATFAGIDATSSDWGIPSSFPGLFLANRWQFEYPAQTPPPPLPPPGLIDAAFFDQPIKDTGTFNPPAAIPQPADNAVISVALNPAQGPPPVSTVEVRTYVGPQQPGNSCTGIGTSTLTCTGYTLLEDSTYAMPASNSINVPFDAAEFNLKSHINPYDGNFQAFYVFAMPTGGSVSCGNSYITHESN